MVTISNDQHASKGAKGIPNDPPYPMSPQSEIRRPVVQHGTKPVATSSKAPALGANAEADSESDWEKDGMDDDDSDWEIENKPSELPKANGTAKEQGKAGLPASLRAGPPSGAILNKKSGDSLLAASSQVSLPATSGGGSSIGGESQISLPHYTTPPPPGNLHDATQQSLRNQYQPILPTLPSAPTPSNLRSGYPPPPGYAPPLSTTHEATQQQATPIKKQTTGEQIFGVESPQWSGNTARFTYDGGAVELPSFHTPRDELAQLSLGSASPQSSQPPLIPVETENDDFTRARNQSNASSHWTPGADVSTFDAMSSRGQRLPSDAVASPNKTWQEQQDWDRAERERKQVEAAIALENAKQAEQMRRAEEEWHRGETERREREQDEEMRRNEGRPSALAAETLPDGSPIPPPPPRNETVPLRSALRQAPEHYAIKQLRWFDARIDRMRTSPILIQNVNGPCPLLALVNALVLSTPDSERTGLIETLRTREQVSLNLVLDAVFDELTSGSRGTSQELPDVAELLQFLRNIHTGMNVNPRFTYLPDRASREMHPAYRPTEGPGGFEETKEMALYSVFDIPLVHGWIPARESAAYDAFQRSAKTYEDAQNVQFFEEELEHKLGTTGLSPQEQDTFEDLHTIKDFLETWPTQLTDVGLKTLLDHIKPGSFCILFRNDHFSLLFKEPKANQLLTLVTDSGYATHDEIAWESLVDVSGQGSEYFSGDFRPVSHNSQPATSSAPIAGPRNSSARSSQHIQSMLDVDGQGGEWSTVQGRRNRPTGQQRQSSTTQNLAAPADLEDDAARVEQEDHDLALALQLQEEEDAYGRRDTEARQRENVFEPARTSNIPVTGPTSNNNNTTTTNINASNPVLPTRPGRNSNTGGSRVSSSNQTAPSNNRRSSGRRRSAAEPMPPPTYEQAAARPPFVPSSDHPLNTGGSAAAAAGGATIQPQQQQQHAPHQSHNSYGPMGNAQWGAGAPHGAAYGMGRGGHGRGRGDRDKCVVM